MPVEDDFLSIIRSKPDKITPQLVYADWLDEQGDPRGELIRLLVEVREMLNKHKSWRHFRRAVAESFGSADPQELIDLLDAKQQRLFACDCAESVLPRFEREHPDCDTPRKAIEAVRRYTNGEISIQEVTAARDACWAAGRPSRAVAGYAWYAATYSRDAAVAALSDTNGKPSARLVWLTERLLAFVTD